MLEGYFGLPKDGTNTEQWKRYLAVQAALEIAKASAAATSQYDGYAKVQNDMRYLTDNISKLADAIQYALDPAEEE